MSHSSRQLSLAPHVRSVAAIGESGEPSGPPTTTQDLSLPGGICTPTRDAPKGALPSREMNQSFLSAPKDAGSFEVVYKFALADLNTRSYFLIHEVPETTARTTSLVVNNLRDAVRQAIVLANVEVCLIRSCQLAGLPSTASVTFDLTCVYPVEPSEPAPERLRRHVESTRALAPVASLLSKCLHACSRRDVSRLLEERIHAAEQLLAGGGCAEELARVEDAVLQELMFTFAAYQPAVLDEELKGSQSPFDPRSHTRHIRDVQALVEGSLRAAATTAPEALARLAMRLLDSVRRQKQNLPLAGWLLQSACMSGHFELATKLLDRRSSFSGLFELDIIRRLRAAWLGYTRYRPLQPARSGALAQTIDWLDFKCSCARAVLIAHKIIETLILRDDKGLTQSVNVAAAFVAAGGDSQQGPEGDPSFSMAVAAAAAADGAAAPDATANGGSCRDSGHQRSRSESGQREKGPSETRVLLVPGSPVAPMACSTTGVAPHGLLNDSNEHVELEPVKWALVRELFPRAAACKPLALAILHVVLACKREIQRAMRAAVAEAAEASPGTAGAELLLPPPDAEEANEAEDEEDKEAAEGEAAERARAEEEARASRYRKLHLLAVQACHLAVHSNSLSTVSDGLACIRAVRAWPAIDLAMLNDLAAAFPHQCAALLSVIPLQEVDLEDNVLPFGLPPGFTTVAVSDQDAQEFRQGGGTGSTQDAEHFATQREADASIEASLLVLPGTWFALLFLFWPAEFASPTTRQLVRVLRCALAAFLCQGPGSCAVAVVFAFLMVIIGATTRCVVSVARILYFGVLYRIWGYVVAHFPGIRQFAYRIRGRPAAVGPTADALASTGPRLGTMRQSGAGGAAAIASPAAPAAGRGAGEEDGEEGGEEGFTRQLGMGIWRTFAHGHNALIDGAVGWGKGSASISCRKLPMPVVYTAWSGHGNGQSGRPGTHQMDTALLEKLLKVPGLHPSVFGSRVLRALILVKWNYFTKYFIILQLLLHISYMAVFIAYAFSIKDMEPVSGRASGLGANTPGCNLEAPTPTQTGLLVVLAVMTVDFLVQELRQLRHFGWMFFTHAWDVLDACSVALVMASVILHFTCTSNINPYTLRGLAAVQIVLLFMRLLYYAMASDKLGSFVRMVLETTYDLFMFFAFLSVVFVGFALAIIVSQGTLADEEQTFIKLFTMMYGDFDETFLSTLDSGAFGLDSLTRVLVSIYMILVTIILLNLLISVISESYEHIRENEKWESLRNKALLVVESETQLWQPFMTWLYTTLTPPSKHNHEDTGKRFLYVIAPEYARRTEADGDDEDEDEDEAGDDGDDDDSQWSGRLGEMKRHITTQARATVDILRKEVAKVMEIVGSVGAAAAAATTAPGSTPGVEVNGTNTVAAAANMNSAGQAASVGGGSGLAAELNERTLQSLVEQVGALVSKEVGTLRKELLAEIGKAAAGGPHQQQQQQQHTQSLGGRLSPLKASLPPLTVGGSASSPVSGALEGGMSPSGTANSEAAKSSEAAASRPQEPRSGAAAAVTEGGKAGSKIARKIS